jgi:hypothetical protein
LPPSLQRLDRVLDQVEQHLLELRAVREQLDGAGRQVERDRHIALLRLRGGHLGDPFEQRLEVDRLDEQRPRPGEVEELGDEPAEPPDLVAHHVDRVEQLRVRVDVAEREVEEGGVSCAPLSGLRISWARPAAMVPIAASRSCCLVRSSSARSSVVSRPSANTETSSPSVGAWVKCQRMMRPWPALPRMAVSSGGTSVTVCRPASSVVAKNVKQLADTRAIAVRIDPQDIDELRPEDLVAREAGDALGLAVEQLDGARVVEPEDDHAGELDGVDVAVLRLRQRAPEDLLLEPLDVLDAGDRVVPVALEHDRQLEVQQAADRAGDLDPAGPDASARSTSDTRISAMAVNM